MSLSDLMSSDAASILAQDGETVTYYSAGGDGGVSVRCAPMSGPVEPRRTDTRRTNAVQIVIAIAKADLADVSPNADTVAVPGSWIGRTGTVTLRVSAIMGDQADPGVWMLGLSK